MKALLCKNCCEYLPKQSSLVSFLASLLRFQILMVNFGALRQIYITFVQEVPIGDARELSSPH